MKVLVTGANGQLGLEMQQAAAELCTHHEFVYAGIETLDISVTSAVMEAVKGVDVIINCAGYTSVDDAEDCVHTAYLINAEAVGNLAAAAKAEGALLIHISSDYVFGGDYNSPITEDDETSPLGVYGHSKLAGEKIVLESGCRSIIIRTSWMYSIYGKNFMKTILSLLSDRSSLNVVYDQVGTPTYAADLARAVCSIVNTANPEEGVYHYSNEGVCSWYDFAVAIGYLAGSSCVVSPCRSKDFPSKVKRPAFSVLDKTKIRTKFNLTIPHWYSSLSRCMTLLKQNNN